MSTSNAEKEQAIAELSREVRLMSSYGSLFSHAIAERLGVNSSDIETFDLLNVLGPMTAGELARRTGLSSGATTRLIDRLERVGWVRRVPDPVDRRRVIIQPIYDNTSAIAELFEPLAKRMAEYWFSLQPEELRIIVDFVRRCNEIVREENARLRSQE